MIVDLKDGLEFVKAVETLELGLAGGGPTAEQASYAFDDEFDEALEIVYGSMDKDT